MKKSYLVMAAAAALFAACSSDSNDADKQTAKEQPQEVNFSAYVNRGTTRAGAPGELVTSSASTGQIDLQTEGFGVFGYYTDNHLYTESSTPNFFYNQKVTYNTTKSVWSYSPVKYWPNEFGGTAISDGVDRLTFFAYAPYTAVDPATGLITDASTSGIMGLTNNTKQGDPLVKYYVDLDPAKCVDLCWGVANTALGATQTVSGAEANNIVVGAPFKDVIKPKTTDKIDWNFKHALASLNVTIDADVDKSTHGTGDEVGTEADGTLDTNTKIFVRSVTFEGFAMQGLLNLNYSAPTPLWYGLTGSNKIGGTTVKIYDARRDGKEGQANASAANETPAGLNPNIISNDGNTKDGVKKTAVNLFNSTTASSPILVIPTGDPLKVTIEYDVETKDTNLPTFLSDGTTRGSIVKNVITKAVTWNNTGNAKMDAGYRYYIKLHLGMTSVKFDATVTSWTDKDTAEPWVPVND